MRFAAFLAAGLVVVLALAFLVSPQASSQPDGLNRVAIDEGFDDTEEVHALDGLPTAGYSVRGVATTRSAQAWPAASARPRPLPSSGVSCCWCDAPRRRIRPVAPSRRERGTSRHRQPPPPR